MNLKKVSNGIRLVITILLVLSAVVFAGIKLMTIQIVDSETYVKNYNSYQTVEQSITSFRGEIVDVNGEKIVSNKLGFDIIVDKSNFPSDLKEGNEILLQTYEIAKEYGSNWEDTLPITMSEPYTFTDDTNLDTLRKRIGVNVYASAEDCMYKLIKDYQISDDYTPTQQRVIAGIRYEMDLRGFSLKNRFTLFEDVDREAVTIIKELTLKLKGIDITEEAIREYSQVDVLPHEIGFVGPIYAEEAEQYKELGYDLNETVGKTGIELGMESVLKGSDGVKEVTLIDGVVASSEVTQEAVSGNTVKLTIDSDFQKDLQKILENFIKYLRNRDSQYSGVKAGAIAVLDAKTGAVLGLATAPTYTLDEFVEDYNSLAEDTSLPLLNRATDGLYRPGSCFKTVTATAGLNEGIVNGGSTFYCGRNYHYRGLTVHCTGFHEYISVSRALQVSCNIYFYNLAQLVGVDTLSRYANMYGLGTDLGLESGDTKGYLANPETFENLGMLWTSGQLLQAGIGQSEIAVTPLQMAVTAMTIGNEGVRYKPYLVDSIWDYSMTECISKTETTIAETIELNYDYVYDYIERGMIKASQNTPDGEYSLNGLGYDVAIKTGTPQSARGTDSSFIGYAPADDPQIAFAGIVEGGEYSKYMIRKILNLYDKYYGIEY